MIILPNCAQTEIEILALAMHNKAAFADLTVRIKPDQFYHQEVGQAFELLIRLDQEGKPHDPATAASESKDLEVTKAITRASSEYVSAERLEYLVSRFLEYHQRRTYHKIGQKLQEMAFDSSIKPSDLTDVVETEMLSIHFAEENREIIDPKTAAIESLDTFYTRESSKEPMGILLSTTTTDGRVYGFPSIDKCLYGLQPGDLILIAGQSGEGKTALAQNIATMTSLSQDYFTYYENTEMNASQMVTRFVAQMTGIPFEEIFTGQLIGTSEQIDNKRKQIELAHDKFARSKIYLSELPSLSLGQSKGLARKFKHKYGRLDLLVIDYVGRMEMDDEMKKGMQEWQVMSRIVKESKKLAQQLKVPVIILAQLTDQGYLEGAKKMINDTDATFFLEKLTDEQKQEYPMATHRLRKRKVRRGSTDRDILLQFNKPIQRITEVYYQR